MPTFEQVIKRHGPLIDDIVANTPGPVDAPGAPLTNEQWVDRIESAANRLTQSPLWGASQEEIRTAHHYLLDALAAEDRAARETLLSQADKHLSMVEPIE